MDPWDPADLWNPSGLAVPAAPIRAGITLIAFLAAYPLQSLRAFGTGDALRPSLPGRSFLSPRTGGSGRSGGPLWSCVALVALLPLRTLVAFRKPQIQGFVAAGARERRACLCTGGERVHRTDFQAGDVVAFRLFTRQCVVERVDVVSGHVGAERPGVEFEAGSSVVGVATIPDGGFSAVAAGAGASGFVGDGEHAPETLTIFLEISAVTTRPVLLSRPVTRSPRPRRCRQECPRRWCWCSEVPGISACPCPRARRLRRWTTRMWRCVRQGL